MYYIYIYELGQCICNYSYFITGSIIRASPMVAPTPATAACSLSRSLLDLQILYHVHLV